MRLLISQYLRLLKERDELDALIPTLFQAMKLTPISRPQTGVRQDGVDIAAVGKDPRDGQDKLFLAVVKRGNIGRPDWNSGLQSIRPSLDEIFDVYLQNNVQPEYKGLPVVIWVCTSGDLLQIVNDNFVGYAKTKEHQAEIIFYGADRLAELIEQYLLNENIFLGNDRKFLRKTLVLIGDIDYDLSDYYLLLLSQLAISHDDQVTQQTEVDFFAALTRIHLALKIVITWGDDAGNLKQPLLAAERTLLWTWHAIVKQNFLDTEKIRGEYASICATYFNVALMYFKKVRQYFAVEDGMTQVSSDSALISISIFRQIAMLASVGTFVISIDNGEHTEEIRPIIQQIANMLRAIIDNNQASSSPRLDENSIDINIAMVFFYLIRDIDFAKNWLKKLISKLVFTVAHKHNYPISSDNLEELAQITHGTFDEDKFMLGATWLVPSLAIWCAFFDMNDEYCYLVRNLITPNFGICPQLWHPVEDTYDFFYFGKSILHQGETEININFGKSISAMKEKILKFKLSERYNVFMFSPSLKRQLYGIELLACKHFRIPVPPVFIYSLFESEAI